MENHAGTPALHTVTASELTEMLAALPSTQQYGCRLPTSKT
jgi:hypothetical protein